MSIVTSDSNVVREQIKIANGMNLSIKHPNSDDSHVMSRMNWIMAVRPLFDSLKAFHNNSK